MKCSTVRLPGGGRAIVCGSRRYRRRQCVKCGLDATRLCDAILGENRGDLAGAIGVTKLKTCDAPLCDRCTSSPRKGHDYCPEHAPAVPKQASLAL